MPAGYSPDILLTQKTKLSVQRVKRIVLFITDRVWSDICRKVRHGQGRIQRVWVYDTPSPQILSAKLCSSAKPVSPRQNEEMRKALFCIFICFFFFCCQFFHGWKPSRTFICVTCLCFGTSFFLFCVCILNSVFVFVFVFFFACFFRPANFSWGQPFGKICKEKNKGALSANWDSHIPRVEKF